MEQVWKEELETTSCWFDAHEQSNTRTRCNVLQRINDHTSYLTQHFAFMRKPYETLQVSKQTCEADESSLGSLVPATEDDNDIDNVSNFLEGVNSVDMQFLLSDQELLPAPDQTPQGCQTIVKDHKTVTSAAPVSYPAASAHPLEMRDKSRRDVLYEDPAQISLLFQSCEIVKPKEVSNYNASGKDTITAAKVHTINSINGPAKKLDAQKSLDSITASVGSNIPTSKPNEVKLKRNGLGMQQLQAAEENMISLRSKRFGENLAPIRTANDAYVQSTWKSNVSTNVSDVDGICLNKTRNEHDSNLVTKPQEPLSCKENPRSINGMHTTKNLPADSRGSENKSSVCASSSLPQGRLGQPSFPSTQMAFKKSSSLVSNKLLDYKRRSIKVIDGVICNEHTKRLSSSAEDIPNKPIAPPSVRSLSPGSRFLTVTSTEESKSDDAANERLSLYQALHLEDRDDTPSYIPSALYKRPIAFVRSQGDTPAKVPKLESKDDTWIIPKKRQRLKIDLARCGGDTRIHHHNRGEHHRSRRGKSWKSQKRRKKSRRSPSRSKERSRFGPSHRSRSRSRSWSRSRSPSRSPSRSRSRYSSHHSSRSDARCAKGDMSLARYSSKKRKRRESASSRKHKPLETTPKRSTTPEAPTKVPQKPGLDVEMGLAAIVTANFRTSELSTKAFQNSLSGLTPKTVECEGTGTLPFETQTFASSEDEVEADVGIQDEHAEFDLNAIQIDMETMKRTVYVHGISPRFTELDLETEFASFGLETDKETDLACINLFICKRSYRPRGDACIRFKSEAEAIHAVKEVHAKVLLNTQISVQRIDENIMKILTAQFDGQCDTWRCWHRKCQQNTSVLKLACEKCHRPRPIASSCVRIQSDSWLCAVCLTANERKSICCACTSRK
uniref:Uncharacterized protein AlNc14C501G11947 n=1 Tax=Albugo laibachii Nc14 TaxID=890382 RepID=F0X0K3_9STRA|nr:conserved hypothetical protein [Albugo laibachii Nc14]|eukprot:CCA27294.1 conserved hypothetical protein [Albugo laibachii Nc14]